MFSQFTYALEIPDKGSLHLVFSFTSSSQLDKVLVTHFGGMWKDFKFWGLPRVLSSNRSFGSFRGTGLERKPIWR